MASLADMIRQKSNFKPDDSMIASAIMHPQQALGKAADWFQKNVNTGMGYADEYDNPNPLLAPSREKQAEAGFNLAGLLQGGAFTSGAAPKSAGGTLGTFAGISAKTAPLDKFAKAEQLANELGLFKHEAQSPMWHRANENIHAQTGIHYGAENKPRFEISDDTSSLADLVNGLTPVNEVFKHKDLFDAYPNMERIGFNVDPNIQHAGTWNDRYQLLSVNPKFNLDPKSTTLHELQHAIQGREDFGLGGNENVALKTYNDQMRQKFYDADETGLFGKYEGLMNNAKPYYRIKQIQDLQNISAPRQLFNSSDFYKHSTELRDILGAPPRSGSKLQWAQDAGNILARKQKEELTWGGKDLLDEVGDDRSIARKAIKSYEGKMGRLGHKKYYDAKQARSEMIRTNPEYNNLTPKEKTGFYNRLAGEAEARATQARMNLTPEERAVRYPFKDYDVNNLIVRKYR